MDLVTNIPNEPTQLQPPQPQPHPLLNMINLFVFCIGVNVFLLVVFMVTLVLLYRRRYGYLEPFTNEGYTSTIFAIIYYVISQCTVTLALFIMKYIQCTGLEVVIYVLNFFMSIIFVIFICMELYTFFRFFLSEILFVSYILITGVIVWFIINIFVQGIFVLL